MIRTLIAGVESKDADHLNTTTALLSNLYVAGQYAFKLGHEQCDQMLKLKVAQFFQ